MNIEKSKQLFEEAQEYIVGGVNSPARAFRSVGDTPRFIKSAKDQYIYDEDGNKYIDYIGSWGPMILGNNNKIIKEKIIEQLEFGVGFGAATKKEVELAKLMCELVPSFEKVRMVTSGTEATMSAIRVARGYTNREKVLKFIGCYHGHHDSLLVKSGSGLLATNFSSPDSKGVTKGSAKDTLLAEYNDIEAVKKIFSENKGEIACVIVEPVPANMGVVLPEENFLQELRKICTENGTILIFDEVINGFRLSLGGAQELFGVTPDLSTFGKIIGGGLPVGAYGGKKEIMDMVAPIGNVYQAGTLAGNPVAVSAGIAQLEFLRDNPNVYKHIDEMADRLFKGYEKVLDKFGKKYTINKIGSIGTLFFTDEKVKSYKEGSKANTDEFARYFRFMLERGSYLAPSQFEAVFLSYAHTKDDIDKTIRDFEEFLAQDR